MKLSMRKMRKLRRRIAGNRCPVRPGITHHWTTDIGIIAGGTLEETSYVKCGAVWR